MHELLYCTTIYTLPMFNMYKKFSQDMYRRYLSVGSAHCCSNCHLPHCGSGCTACSRCMLQCTTRV